MLPRLCPRHHNAPVQHHAKLDSCTPIAGRISAFTVQEYIEEENELIHIYDELMDDNKITNWERFDIREEYRKLKKEKIKKEIKDGK